MRFRGHAQESCLIVQGSFLQQGAMHAERGWPLTNPLKDIPEDDPAKPNKGKRQNVPKGLLRE